MCSWSFMFSKYVVPSMDLLYIQWCRICVVRCMSAKCFMVLFIFLGSRTWIIKVCLSWWVSSKNLRLVYDELLCLPVYETNFRWQKVWCGHQLFLLKSVCACVLHFQMYLRCPENILKRHLNSSLDFKTSVRSVTNA